MKTKTTLLISAALIIIALTAGALLWEKLPEQMASHWDANNEVNGYMSKTWGVFMMPLITAGMLALFLVVPQIDPLKANIAQFRGIFNLFIILIIGFMLYAHSLTLAWNLGYRFKMGAAIMPFMGILFIAIGQMLKQAKRNYFIGIRTPWTLSSDMVWNQTHKAGATLFTVSGVFALLGGFIGGAAAIWLMFVPLMTSVVFLIAYSYILYARENQA